MGLTSFKRAQIKQNGQQNVYIFTKLLSGILCTCCCRLINTNVLIINNKDEIYEFTNFTYN